mmetsp:Transcript_67210/g.108249  ORF Transcript_67210/g.108249 Transcript_67210/m.108249 type:complete len:321 (-) Transcript_67210:25-987(-)
MAEGDFVPLTHEILSQSLSQIDRAVGGGGFAFTRLDCSNKELTDLGNKVDGYTQLRHVILSHNKLDKIDALTRLPHLLTLQLDDNQVNSLACLTEAAMPWCQRIDLTTNKLKSLPSLTALSRLRFACFASNEITTLEGFGDHPALEELQLQENQLTSLKGLGRLAGLRRLVASSNQLSSLEGLDAPVLTKLELSKNQLVSLQHIGGAPNCEELDLGENQLSTEDPNLPELRRLGNEMALLKSLVVAGNASDLRIEAIVAAPQLQSIDGEPVTAEDRESATAKVEELTEAIKAREEEMARQAEEAAAAAAAAEAEVREEEG